MRRYVNPPSIWEAIDVELEDLLNAMDRTAANLAKLDNVWGRAVRFMPTGPARGSNPEYDDLRRAWADLLPGLPLIDGWTITGPLPDIDEIGQIFIDCFEISQYPSAAYEMAQQPGKDLAEYRYRLNRAHRRAATIALPWDRLDDDGFERLLYDLLRDLPDHHNVQWLMQTRAPDRGRDLSLDRVLRDSTGSVRSERVIVQAKHWLKRSVGPAEVADTVHAIKLWEPPVVRGLVIATSGRFSADAVAWAEKHNNDGAAPFIELWPESKLETLLARRPYLAAAHGLR